MSTYEGPVFDVDNHLYETGDALTRYLPKQYEGFVKYVEVHGRTKIAINNVISESIPNPTFEVVARRVRSPTTSPGGTRRARPSARWPVHPSTPSTPSAPPSPGSNCSTRPVLTPP